MTQIGGLVAHADLGGFEVLSQLIQAAEGRLLRLEDFVKQPLDRLRLRFCFALAPGARRSVARFLLALACSYDPLREHAANQRESNRGCENTF